MLSEKIHRRGGRWRLIVFILKKNAHVCSAEHTCAILFEMIVFKIKQWPCSAEQLRHRCGGRWRALWNRDGGER